MLKAPTIPYYTQAEAARRLGWTRQRMWWTLHTNAVSCVQTKGERPAVLLSAEEVERLEAIAPPPRKRVAKATARR